MVTLWVTLRRDDLHRPAGTSRAAARLRRRAAREQAIVAATRRLFDERGLQDARVDDIARAAGLNKALIYRAFSSKEEIFALTATSYLDELRSLTEGAESLADGSERLREVLTVFADFCVTYPAFLDWACRCCAVRRSSCATSCPTPHGSASPERSVAASAPCSARWRPAWRSG